MVDEPGAAPSAGSVRRSTHQLRLAEHGTPGVPPGLVIKMLRVDEERGDWTWLASTPPAWQEDRAEIHPTVEEALVLRGDVLLGHRGAMGPGDYFWRAPNVEHGPMYTHEGHVIFFRTKGGSMDVRHVEVPDGEPWSTSAAPREPLCRLTSRSTPGEVRRRLGAQARRRPVPHGARALHRRHRARGHDARRDRAHPVRARADRAIDLARAGRPALPVVDHGATLARAVRPDPALHRPGGVRRPDDRRARAGGRQGRLRRPAGRRGRGRRRATTPRRCAALVDVDYEPLPVVARRRGRAGRRRAPRVRRLGRQRRHRRCRSRRRLRGRAAAADARRSRRSSRIHRYSSQPIEPRGYVADWDPREQSLHVLRLVRRTRTRCAGCSPSALRLDENQVRVDRARRRRRLRAEDARASRRRCWSARSAGCSDGRCKWIEEPPRDAADRRARACAPLRDRVRRRREITACATTSSANVGSIGGTARLGHGVPHRAGVPDGLPHRQHRRRACTTW